MQMPRDLGVDFRKPVLSVKTGRQAHSKTTLLNQRLSRPRASSNLTTLS